MMSSSHINHETGEPVGGGAGGGRSQRFSLWLAFLVFSSVVLGSAVDLKNNQPDLIDAATNWTVAGSAITFAFTLIVVVCHLIPIASTVIVGTRVEASIIFVLICFWAAIVAVITDPVNNLGVDEDGTDQVINGNLYYFSWAGFFTSIVLMVSYLKASFGLDVAAYRNRAARMGLWAALLASSLIVMGSSIRSFNGEGCRGYYETLCKRTKLGISLGVLGIFFSVLMVAMKLMTASAPFVVEAVTSLLLTIMSAFGVAYLTSPSGPGSAIGNLYYSSWISFLCSCMLLASCWEQRTSSSRGGDGGPAAGNGSGKPDHTEGTLEDQI